MVNVVHTRQNSEREPLSLSLSRYNSARRQLTGVGAQR